MYHILVNMKWRNISIFRDNLDSDRHAMTSDHAPASRKAPPRGPLSAVCALALAALLPALWLWPAPTAAQVSLDLRDVSLRDFVQIVAESTGRNFILDSQVQGSVTVIAPARISPDAINEIFLNVLELNRLTIVEGAETDRIVPMAVARELAPAPGANAGGGAFETRVIEVRNTPVEDVVQVIQPLLPADAVLSTVPGAGQIILSDRAENFDRITRLVRQLDTPRETAIESLPLRHGAATELAQVIQGLGIIPPGSGISADARANAIVVSGPTEVRSRVRQLVAQLDTPQRSLVTSVIRLNYANAADLEPVVRQSFGAGGGAEGAAPSTNGITIVAEPQRNALVVSAPAERIPAIAEAIAKLDLRPAQVLIEAVIFELSVDSFSDLSVQFGAVINNAAIGGVQFGLEGRPTLSSLVSAVLGSGAGTLPAGAGNGGILAVNEQFGDVGFAGFLAALASKTSTKLLSTPSILTLNNLEAEIVVAQNVPFVTGSFATVGDSAIPEQPFQTIERQDVGLTLRVTPQIASDQMVRMAIQQEVSNLTRAASAAGGEITAKRTISTNVLVRDGNVIMLGGLLEDGDGSAAQRVPGLSNLPLVGNLFRGRNVSQNQRILLVMMRPRVLTNDAETDRLMRQLADDARRITETIQPIDDGRYPRVPRSEFPFDGANLNQAFDAGFADGAALSRQFPPLPSRLEFRDN